MKAKNAPAPVPVPATVAAPAVIKAETSPEKVTPALSVEQKLAFRDMQYQLMRLAEQQREIQQKAMAIETEFRSKLEQISKDLGVSDEEYAFNLESLTYVPVDEVKQ